MSKSELSKKYDNGDLTIVWKPGLCAHAGECVKRLPQVYQPKEKPWIKVGVANAEQLKAQINACPSGALSYITKEETS